MIVPKKRINSSWCVDGGLDWQMLVKLNVCLTKSEWISKAKAGWAHGPSGRHCCSDLPPRHREPRKQTMCVRCRFEGAEMGFWACWRRFFSLTRGKFASHSNSKQLLMENRRMFGTFKGFVQECQFKRHSWTWTVCISPWEYAAHDEMFSVCTVPVVLSSSELQ